MNLKRFPSKAQRIKILKECLMMLIDASLILLAIHVSALLRYDGAVSARAQMVLNRRLHWIVIINVASLAFVGVYRIIWKYGGIREYGRVGVACMLGASVNIGLSLLFRWALPRTVLIIAGMSSAIMICVVRVIISYISEAVSQGLRSSESDRRYLVIGAGEGGLYAVRFIRARRMGVVVGLIDDDPAKQNLRVSGVNVIGTTADIPKIARNRSISDIVIAITRLEQADMERIGNLCALTRCTVKVLSHDNELNSGENRQQPVFKRLNASMFLKRPEVKLDHKKITDYINDKTVLVTGGGGSIGSEICRQLVRFSPKKLVVFDVYENGAYELQMELNRKRSDLKLEVVIGSIRDKRRLDSVMDEYKPEVVFHAAAHKHVPLMETSPAEAVKNNVFGTYNLLKSASEHGVERLVQLSTDKAVNPTNVMGATKRITEMLVQMFARNTEMKCMAVRFGNVLGSHGSVIPLFEEQILDGGPVTLTHPEITRYFMTIPEAAQLVLQAGALAKSGSIYVLDMGEPVKIYELAEKLIRFYGYEPGKDIEIKITGLRPGEKLYEELMMDTEIDQMGRTAHNKILVAPPISMDERKFMDLLEELKVFAEAGDIINTLVTLREIVPTYKPRRERKAGKKKAQ
ncbi:MAG: polysaccharide biosynthesis protein [Clostridia bacterium]|nr:polysaccharide biosynthesis protein [Clostridia bacterium]